MLKTQNCVKNNPNLSIVTAAPHKWNMDLLIPHLLFENTDNPTLYLTTNTNMRSSVIHNISKHVSSSSMVKDDDIYIL